MEQRVKIDISIITSGDEKLIFPCLNSIYKTHQDKMEIFVTSNLAPPKIINKIKKQFPEVHFIMNKERKGFAENHNNIIERAHGEYILILNDDTVVLDNAIEKLIAYMNKNPDVAVISPQLLNSDLSLQHSTYGFPNLFTTTLGILGIRKLIPFNKFTYKFVSFFFKRGGSRFWEHNKTCEVDTMRGACVLVRRKAIEEVGLMDEVSLAYGEETEWHYRFKKGGWKIIFYPEAQTIHYGGQTTKNQPLHIKKEEIKGSLNFYRKHRNILEYFSLRVMIIFTVFLKWIFNFIIQQKGKANLYLNIIKIALNPGKAYQGKRVFY